MNVSVVILAAGRGTRMKSPTPKVLHRLCGREMLYYVIREAQKLSDDITVVLGHQAERVKEAMEAHFQGIRYVIQDMENYPGTGGAMKNISTRHGQILVLNGDMPLVEAEELERFMEQRCDIAMSVLKLDNPAGYGRVVIDDSGHVKKIVEEKDASESIKAIQCVNGGVYLFDRFVLDTYLPKLSNDNAQKEYYLTDVIGMAAADSRTIQPVHADERNYRGVNSKNDLARAEGIMLTRIREKWMKAGVLLRMPETIYIEDSVEFSGECELHNGVSIQGVSRIEESVIKAHSVIEDAELIRSSAGPMARIRPKSRLVDSHVGNYVEVKKSNLNGVKAGHLSYLGDADIDAGTNVGAGTITCNYDGIKKHKTVIGKNVFIGSDTQLVAPVTIEDNVLIAAGTTVTANAPKGSLIISRVKQSIKEGFYERFFKNVKE